MTNYNPYQIAQDVTTQLRRAIDTMRHVTEEINSTIQRLQEMKAEAFTEIELKPDDYLQCGDVIHYTCGFTPLIVAVGNNLIVKDLASYPDIIVTRRVPAPVCPDIPADKILVDRAQYERMQAFVLKTFEALPHYTSQIGDFYNDMREICAIYSRGETP